MRTTRRAIHLLRLDVAVPVRLACTVQVQDTATVAAASPKRIDNQQQAVMPTATHRHHQQQPAFTRQLLQLDKQTLHAISWQFKYVVVKILNC